MPLLSGNPDKPRIKLRIRNYKALKKYAEHPKCLNCGYDLRGQYMAGLSHCSECGQSCTYEDLADLIAGQRAGFIPVITEMRGGVKIALCYPLIVFGQLMCISPVQWYLESNLVIVVTIMLVINALIYLAWLGFTLFRAYQVFGNWRGILHWMLSFIYASVFLVGLIPLMITAGFLIVYVVSFFDRHGSREEMNAVFTWGWPYLMIVGAVLLIVINEWWSTKWVVKPCRKRCRELVLELLSPLPEVKQDTSPI